MKIRLEKDLETFQLTLKKQIEHHTPMKQTVLFVCLLCFFIFPGRQEVKGKVEGEA